MQEVDILTHAHCDDMHVYVSVGGSFEGHTRFFCIKYRALWQKMQEVSYHIHQICIKYALNMHQIFFCSKYRALWQKMQEVSYHIHQICIKYASNMHQICMKYASNMHQKCIKHSFTSNIGLFGRRCRRYPILAHAPCDDMHVYLIVGLFFRTYRAL